MKPDAPCPGIPVSDAVVNLGALTLLLQGLRTGNGDLSDGMHDRLHEPYRWRLIKGGDAVKAAALEAGAWGCAISGAGPGILALCSEDKGQLEQVHGSRLGGGRGRQPGSGAESPDVRQSWQPAKLSRSTQTPGSALLGLMNI